MTTLHTPGPWVLADENNQCCSVLLGEKHNLTCSLDRQDGNTGAFVIERDEMLANGRLMSAAPEMLRILVDTYYRLADIHNEWPGRDSLAGQKRLCDMRDCIAKALGVDPKDVYEGEAMRMGVAP